MMGANTNYMPKIEKRYFDNNTLGRGKTSIVGKIELVSEWIKRARYRRELRRLIETGHHLILDTGLGLDEAMYEVSKPFYIE